MDGISTRSVLFVLRLLRPLFNRLVRLKVSRVTCAKDVSKAFQSLSLRAHPDKGGDQADFQRLSAANDALQEVLKGKGSLGLLEAAIRTP